MIKAQEFIQTEQTRAGYHALPTDVPMPLLQVAQQGHFQFIAGAETGMPAFRGKRLVALPVPKQARLAQAGTCGNHGGIAAGIRRAGLQSQQIVRAQCRQAIGSRLQVVEQGAMRKAELPLQCIGIDAPGQIGDLRHPTPHRAGDAENRVCWRIKRGQKLAQQGLKSRVVAARITGLVRNFDTHTAYFDERQMRLGTADVAREKIIHGC